MSRFRFLVVTIEELEPGAFQWLLLESFDDSSEFSAIERSKVTFPTHQVARGTPDVLRCRHVCESARGAM